MPELLWQYLSVTSCYSPPSIIFSAVAMFRRAYGSTDDDAYKQADNGAGDAVADGFWGYYKGPPARSQQNTKPNNQDLKSVFHDYPLWFFKEHSKFLVYNAYTMNRR